MKKIMGLILSGVLLSTTSAFAGLTLSSSNPEYNTQTVKVKCTDSAGKVLADRNAIVGQNVAWFLVKAGFLAGGTVGHCVFTYTKTGAEMGEGDVSLSGVFEGKVSNVKSGVGFNVTVSPDQTAFHSDVTISIS